MGTRSSASGSNPIGLNAPSLPRRASAAARLTLAFGATLLLSCSADFEKQSLITKLRVLGVQFEPAELIADPNAEPPKTRMTAFGATPDDAPIGLRWALCTVQGTIPPPSIDCPGAQGFDLPVDSNGVGTLDFGMEPFRTVYNQVLSGQAGIPADQVKEQLKTGVPIIIGFSARAGTEQLLGVTTVTIRSPDAARPTNLNPGLIDLKAGDASIAADGSTQIAVGATIRLTPVAAAGAHDGTSDGAEKLNFSFYATDGEVQTLRSADTTATGQPVDPSIDFLAPKTPGKVQIWVVARDGRGGMGLISRSVQVK